MEIWLDTVNEAIIEKASEAGLVFGVTTNPQVLASSALPPVETLERLLAVQPGPVAFQVQAASAKEMIDQGRTYAKLSPRLMIKIPVTSEGYQTIRCLSRLGIHTIATVIFHYHQAVFASQAGACYLAPYFSRMRMHGIDAVQELAHICAFAQGAGQRAKVLVASLKESEDFQMATQMNAAAVTLKEDLFKKLFSTSSYTAAALKAFENA